MTKIIGHRGARGLAPENTVKAIEVALAHHVDGVEIDARVSKDGIVVLSHDPTIAKLVIRNENYETLKKQKSELATLDEALTAMRSKCSIRIEIKPKVPVEPIVRIVRQELASNKEADISILSFSQSVLLQVQAQLPNIPLIVNEKWSSMRARWRMKQLGTTQLQMNQRWLWSGFLWAMHRGGIHMMPYTVNSIKRATRWEPYIDGIVTDFPDRFDKK
jgi:glycerophosphoryl diester phosphodiesterase